MLAWWSENFSISWRNSPHRTGNPFLGSCSKRAWEQTCSLLPSFSSQWTVSVEKEVFMVHRCGPDLSKSPEQLGVTRCFWACCCVAYARKANNSPQRDDRTSFLYVTLRLSNAKKSSKYWFCRTVLGNRLCLCSFTYFYMVPASCEIHQKICYYRNAQLHAFDGFKIVWHLTPSKCFPCLWSISCNRC